MVPEKLMIFVLLLCFDVHVSGILIRLLYRISLAWIPLSEPITVSEKLTYPVLLLFFDVSESVDPDQAALPDQSGLDPHCQSVDPDQTALLAQSGLDPHCQNQQWYLKS